VAEEEREAVRAVAEAVEVAWEDRLLEVLLALVYALNVVITKRMKGECPALR